MRLDVDANESSDRNSFFAVMKHSSARTNEDGTELDLIVISVHEHDEKCSYDTHALRGM